MIYITAFAVLIIAYLLGSLNGSIILSSLKGEDIRKLGSGNAGSTNMLRTYGKKYAAFTFLVDFFKGVIAVLLGVLVCNLIKNNTNGIFNTASIDTPFKAALLDSLKYIAGIGVILGHVFPLYFGFKGGKGIATGSAIIITINPVVGITVTVLSIAVMAVSKYVSLGSVMSGFLYIIGSLIKDILVSGSINISNLLFGIIITVIIVTKHIPNIKRLLNGTENKLGQKR